ncbi:uncharacterized protein M6B38_310780 [Iris pallida]|uniref:DUF4408 domain-containing protein n=1 Tax=Iris pallida TaxID=29817 RepID=A0AAX6HIP9_IRIPA|nr:uncharacterized protein M6B38_240680 [Iris pallida]KAJ6840345.1 uncharacterized protein M6B38_310780 [Iris pallida]
MVMMNVEKSTAGRRYRKLQRAFTLLRCLELAVLLLLALRGLPAAARASGSFLRLSVSVLLGPRFLFLLGNAIVIHLFLNKTNKCTSGGAVDIEGTIVSSFIPPPPPATCEGKVVYEDKEEVVVVLASGSEKSTTGRACRRTRSERMHVRRRKEAPPVPELRRSSTDVDPKVTAGEEDEVGDAEEFRRTIEAFIEKQQLKFQREEESMSTATTTMVAIVSSSPQVVKEKE